MAEIAIVDDNEAWCFATKVALEAQGHSVELFTDPHAFLSKSDRFDLAVIDFIMPPRNFQVDLDGLSLIRQLQQRDRSPLLILVSSFFSHDLLAADSELGQAADAVLPKPSSLKPLLNEIQQLLAASNKLGSSATVTQRSC